MNKTNINRLLWADATFPRYPLHLLILASYLENYIGLNSLDNTSSGNQGAKGHINVVRAKERKRARDSARRDIVGLL